jgi:hypothetical protein
MSPLVKAIMLLAFFRSGVLLGFSRRWFIYISGLGDRVMTIGIRSVLCIERLRGGPPRSSNFTGYDKVFPSIKAA